MLKVCEVLRHQVRPVTYDLFRFLATNDTIFQLAIALRVGRIASYERRQNELWQAGREAAAPVTLPLLETLYYHITLSLSLSLTRLLYQIPRT